MNTFIESAKIALAAIWSAKLRSFMTVLGNIVAVTSIIAVVSLIQGLNASVKQAILNQAGADSFSIQQFPITRSDEEFDQVRSNPRITLQDMRAIRRYSGDRSPPSWPTRPGRGRITYRDKSIDNTQIEGVTSSYVNFSSFDAERGRLMSPTEVDTLASGHGARLADGRPAVRHERRSARQDHPDRGRALPGRRRQREEGVDARPVAGRVRDHPARPVPDDVRIATVARR